jgi:hypothetical protein
MKKYYFFLASFLMLFILFLPSAKTPAESELPGSASLLLPDQTNTTITVTITAINLNTNTVTLKDQDGKIYVFVVDPQVIDLKKLKVGNTYTATISTTVSTDKVTRARITKAQLIKLQ